VAIGTVRDLALKGAPLLALRPWEKCGDCPYLPVCVGGCLGGQYLKTGRLDEVNCKKAWFEASFSEAVPRRYLAELAEAPWDGEA
jgi:sulfatase maturation enzyme AslB (radical SAM superfamily)